MLVSFDLLPNNARVWVYQAARELNEQEVRSIEESLEIFVNDWKRHGEPLKASFKILHNQFIILGVDESYNNVSGCSIDSSVHKLQELEQVLNVDLMNKMAIAFKVGDNVNTLSMLQFQQFVKEGKISSDTIVFNNLINSKQELESNWQIPASKSWHNRFFNTVKS
ncbi:hypothetical protein KH5_21950 [Urechidicola sp. KH5]